MYIADGDYIKDIEVNDLRNRYTLTKGSTQKMVNISVMFTDGPRQRLELLGSTPIFTYLAFVDEAKAYLNCDSTLQPIFGIC